MGRKKNILEILEEKDWISFNEFESYSPQPIEELNQDLLNKIGYIISIEKRRLKLLGGFNKNIVEVWIINKVAYYPQKYQLAVEAFKDFRDNFIF